MIVFACYFRTRHGVSLHMFHQRKHIRLREFDYSSPNAYFSTVCVKHFAPLLGTVRNGICGLSEIGNETALQLQGIPFQHQHALLDEYIVMPNHPHCILVRTHRNHVYTGNQFGKTVAGSVSTIINHIKGAVTKWCGANGYSFEWQSRFYDHVIRNEQEYRAIKNYIINNPLNWQQDRFYP
jgi:putative transposase